MGDRRNVLIRDDDGPNLFLYTHWGGTNLPEVVARALDRGRPRWEDAPYLTRIIFSEMIQGDVLGELGYGISTSPPGGNHPHIVIDVDAGTADGEPFEDYVKRYLGEVE